VVGQRLFSHQSRDDTWSLIPAMPLQSSQVARVTVKVQNPGESGGIFSYSLDRSIGLDPEKKAPYCPPA
jgi:hypothetical protein